MNNPHLILVLLSSLLLSSTSCFAVESEVDDEHPFTYTQGPKGPDNWSLLNSTWQACNTGKQQSPIDICSREAQVLNDKGRLARTYLPAPAEIVNRGHDIVLKWKGNAGKVNINGVDYPLLQCHWHSPSEHTMNGKKFDIEMHVVHQNANNQIAVIGVLHKIGAPDPLLAKLLPHLANVTEAGKDLGIVDPKELNFRTSKYYRYMGSLTVPPCTEGVTWTVSRKTKTVSLEQVEALRNAVKDGFENNARPIQPLLGRTVDLYVTKHKNRVT